jgi:hypothetical protein
MDQRSETVVVFGLNRRGQVNRKSKVSDLERAESET